MACLIEAGDQRLVDLVKDVRLGTILVSSCRTDQ